MLARVMGSPSSSTAPLCRTRPRMDFISVVFPAPFSPKRPTSSPGPMEKLTSFKAGWAP